IKGGIRELVIKSEAFPVMCGSAYKNKGVQPMLNAVIDYLPSPLDVPPMIGHNPSNDEEELTRKPAKDEPFYALEVKDSNHPFFGSLSFVIVYSDTVYITVQLFVS